MLGHISNQDYVRSKGIDKLIDFTNKPLAHLNSSVDPEFSAPCPPNIDKLVMLHKLCIDRKVTTVLDVGCGYSTLVFAHALKINSGFHSNYIRQNLRRHNCFEVHSVDDVQKYIDLAAKLIPDDLTEFVSFHKTTVRMTKFDGRICTEYQDLPNICPDLIYLDGPSQHSVLDKVNGITTVHPDRFPMSCDLLMVEHFLLPGTLIVVDGRAANVRFLKANFQRQWAYEYKEENDAHVFELQEEPLGEHNKRQIDYCLESKWLLS